MHSSMTFTSIAAIFAAMVMLAAMPSVSVFAVAARSAASGFVHGLFTTMGIVAGDVVFIMLAIYGLSVLAEAMGGLFLIVKCLGGSYLIWLGVQIWRSSFKEIKVESVTDSSFTASFLTGLLITLGDLKAIFFYLGFFPAFLDLSTVSVFDTGIIIAITIVAVGGVKLVYAYLADRARRVFKDTGAGKVMGIIAGGAMIGVGIMLLATALSS